MICYYYSKHQTKIAKIQKNNTEFKKILTKEETKKCIKDMKIVF